MTKQEIDGLKVGDVIIHKGNQEIIIKEILVSKVIDSVVFVSDSVYLDSEVLKLKCYKLKQQPKKIPYTLETFPENALWIRNKNWKNGEKATFNVREDYNGNIRVWFFNCLSTENFEISDLDKAKNYEIGFLKDEKIQWKPFYQV